MPYKDKEKQKEHSRRYYQEHKEQLRVRSNKWYLEHKGEHRKYHRRRREEQYGMREGEYERLLVEQNNICAICGKPETTFLWGKIRPLTIDHNHQTNKVRGLLCNCCNTGLGLIGEDNLEKAVSYIKKEDNESSNIHTGRLGPGR